MIDYENENIEISSNLKIFIIFLIKNFYLEKLIYKKNLVIKKTN